MTRLRKTMLEELQRRNYSQSTVKAYLHSVEAFAKHFHRPPDQLGPEQIRSYQVYLLKERKMGVRTVGLHTAALRFNLRGSDAQEDGFAAARSEIVLDPLRLLDGGIIAGEEEVRAHLRREIDRLEEDDSDARHDQDRHEWAEAEEQGLRSAGSARLGQVRLLGRALPSTDRCYLRMPALAK